MSKAKNKIKRIVLYMKSGRRYTHFTDSINERDVIEMLKSKTFGFESQLNKSFSSYRSTDVERIEFFY